MSKAGAVLPAVALACITACGTSSDGSGRTSGTSDGSTSTTPGDGGTESGARDASTMSSADGPPTAVDAAEDTTQSSSTGDGFAADGPADGIVTPDGGTAPTGVISPAVIQKYVDSFNSVDTTEAKVVTAIPDSQAAAWITNNVPLFECSDASVEEMYYFRWWSYRKHIKETASGYIITEFLFNVGWAGLDNSIDDAAGHHFYEGRWISNRQYLQDYAKFWLGTTSQGVLSYSNWIPAGFYAAYLVDGDNSFISGILANTVTLYQDEEAKWLDATPGLYHIVPDRDAMEDPISGTGDQYRPSINAYAYGNAMAISRMAALVGNTTLSQQYASKASAIQTNVQNLLWNKTASFFEVVYRNTTTFSAVREEIGLVPWYFNLPAAGMGYENAWAQLNDSAGFFASYGPTTAEQRNPKFSATAGSLPGQHPTQWNGPSWPFATSQTLVALGNVLRNYTQSVVSKADYLATFNMYTLSQHKAGHPWIAEDLNPLTGAWTADIVDRRGVVPFLSVPRAAA
jgi:hypothetical protein